MLADHVCDAASGGACSACRGQHGDVCEAEAAGASPGGFQDAGELLSRPCLTTRPCIASSSLVSLNENHGLALCVCGLCWKGSHLDESIGNTWTLQEFMASVEHSAALQSAQQQAQEALQREIDAMQADHARALRAAEREREALAKVTCQA